MACLEKDLSEKETRSNRPRPVLIAVCDQNGLIKALVNVVLDGQLYGSGCRDECLVSANSSHHIWMETNMIPYQTVLVLIRILEVQVGDANDGLKILCS